MAARLAAVPVIISTVTGLGALYADQAARTRLVRHIYQGLQRIACAGSDLTIFQNHDDARLFIETGIARADKTAVVPGSGVSTAIYSQNAVPTSCVLQLRQSWGVQPGELVVTMVSRVIRSKGVLHYAAAARLIRAAHKSVRFVLVGADDPQSVDRLNSKENAEVKQVVACVGPSDNIPAILAASDIFVLPSAYPEGIPRVLLEAASMGLPIITSNSPGCKEVVGHNVNGLLIQVGDVSALAGAIVKLATQPQLRREFGRLSRRRAVERFDVSVIADATRSVYENLLKRKMTDAAS